MPCRVCGSDDIKEMNSEIALHFPHQIEEPHIFIFPVVTICVNCGFASFSVPKADLSLMKKGRFSGEPNP